MKIELRKTKQKGVVQITTLDERWYLKDDVLYPSVTWIASSYPKGIGFHKWLAQKGWDEAEAIKQAAGDKGSKVHVAVELLLKGETIKMDEKFMNPTTEQPEELTVEEYEAVMNFADWYSDLAKEHKLKVIKTEHVAINEKENYAGTIDLVLEIDGEKWIIDFKTSQNVWPEHEIQISAYKHCGLEDAKLGVLQVGYKRNQRGWKFNEIEDKFDLFLHAKAIWKNENENVSPRQKDYPVELKLNL